MGLDSQIHEGWGGREERTLKLNGVSGGSHILAEKQPGESKQRRTGGKWRGQERGKHCTGLEKGTVVGLQ